MKRYWKIFVGTGVSAMFLATVLPASAQEPAPATRGVFIEHERIFQQKGGPEGPSPPLGDTFVFVASEMSFDGKPVTGAPYSAQAVTETTQTLGDGNRIINKTTSAIYRDSEGRTRREQSLRAIGPFAAKGEPLQTIIISDPVASVSYTLDPRTHIARKMPAFNFEFRTAPLNKPGAAEDGEAVMIETAPFTAGVRVPGPPLPPSPLPQGEGVKTDIFTLRTPDPAAGAQFLFKREGIGAHDKGVTENLGTQSIEGVNAEGSRTTVTIPAGDIGNERPIEIVSERWYSPELKTVIMTRHSDPRFGETVYRLTNISRNEPAKSLFEVPADYRLKEVPVGPVRWKRAAPPPAP